MSHSCAKSGHLGQGPSSLPEGEAFLEDDCQTDGMGGCSWGCLCLAAEHGEDQAKERDTQFYVAEVRGGEQEVLHS